MVNIKFEQFKWDAAGYKEVQGSSGIQGMLSDVAEGIKSRANAAVSASHSNIGYATASHHTVVDGTKNLFAPRTRLVVTTTNLAKYEQARNKTLTTAIGGGA